MASNSDWDGDNAGYIHFYYYLQDWTFVVINDHHLYTHKSDQDPSTRNYKLTTDLQNIEYNAQNLMVNGEVLVESLIIRTSRFTGILHIKNDVPSFIEID